MTIFIVHRLFVLKYVTMYFLCLATEETVRTLTTFNRARPLPSPQLF